MDSRSRRAAYDPTTGRIRSASTDDIACWFIDTDYNGESFFVRHAYFTGAEEPYDKLKRALRAEIDEAAWSCLYRTVSRPFPRPASGITGVRAIDHYGDIVAEGLGCERCRWHGDGSSLRDSAGAAPWDGMMFGTAPNRLTGRPGTRLARQIAPS